MSATTRAHVYLSAEERAAAELAADEHAASLSYVVRVAVRLMFGMAVPREWRELAEHNRNGNGGPAR